MREIESTKHRRRLCEGRRFPSGRPVFRIIEVSGRKVVVQEIPNSGKAPRPIGFLRGELETGRAKAEQRKGFFKGLDLLELGKTCLIIEPFRAFAGDPLIEEDK